MGAEVSVQYSVFSIQFVRHARSILQNVSCRRNRSASFTPLQCPLPKGASILKSTLASNTALKRRKRRAPSLQQKHSGFGRTDWPRQPQRGFAGLLVFALIVTLG